MCVWQAVTLAKIFCNLFWESTKTTALWKGEVGRPSVRLFDCLSVCACLGSVVLQTASSLARSLHPWASPPKANLALSASEATSNVTGKKTYVQFIFFLYIHKWWFCWRLCLGEVVCNSSEKYDLTLLFQLWFVSSYPFSLFYCTALSMISINGAQYR